jgi:hypothetical protein
MGYYSRLDGSLMFEPPLSHQAAKDYQLTCKPGWQSVYFVIDKVTRETVDGTLTSLTSSVIMPHDESGKYYDIEDDIRRLLSYLPDRTFTGYIERDGEEQGDIERYTVEDGKLVTKKAKVVWSGE